MCKKKPRDDSAVQVFTDIKIAITINIRGSLSTTKVATYDHIKYYYLPRCLDFRNWCYREFHYLF